MIAALRTLRTAVPIALRTARCTPMRCSQQQGSSFSSAPASSGFDQLGLSPAILEGLAAKGFESPTAVQEQLIPRLLQGENLVVSASTGSGKTLAYLLPVIQSLSLNNTPENGMLLRPLGRPRCLILVPTRELAKQVLQEAKSYFLHLYELLHD